MGNENKLDWKAIITFLIIVALIVGGFMWYFKQDDIRVAKISITPALQKYSSGIITDEDYDIEKVESKSTNNREIYRVTMHNSSKLLLDGTVYVGLVKSSGSVDRTYVSTDLYQLYETINR